MKKGGYQILDFSNYKFTGNATLEIRGIYDILEANTKPIYVSGINAYDIEYNDEICVVYKYNTSYIIIHSECIIYIDDNDIVKVFEKCDSHMSLTDPTGDCNALAVILFAMYTNRVWTDDATETYTVIHCDYVIADGTRVDIIEGGNVYRYIINLTNNRFERTEL